VLRRDRLPNSRSASNERRSREGPFTWSSRASLEQMVNFATGHEFALAGCWGNQAQGKLTERTRSYDSNDASSKAPLVHPLSFTSSDLLRILFLRRLGQRRSLRLSRDCSSRESYPPPVVITTAFHIAWSVVFLDDHAGRPRSLQQRP
jgi:hypothetical protein